jgi:hypothetical protein
MRAYFEGKYYKQQANGKTLALMPGRSSEEAFVHVITNTQSFTFPFDLKEYKKDADVLKIGDNEFSNTAIKLNINRGNLSLRGELEYNNLTPINGDIMGPFQFFPMECRHTIISMKHEVNGEILLNGEKLCFNNGNGYIEGDSGYSFPEKYSWVHCNDFTENCSITAAVAKIPFMGFHFWGCICVVWLDGKEYRLETYKGVKILFKNSLTKHP